MITGTVKFFNTTKGFGFIAPEDGSKDVFVHISAVERSGMPPLVEGQQVSFEVQADPRGPTAVNLQRSEERRGGKDWVSTCRSRRSPALYNKKNRNNRRQHTQR